MDDAGFFDGLMRWPVPEHGVQVPLFFPDLGGATLVFTAASDAVRPLLPSGLKPVDTLPGRCLFVVGALQYRAGDLGPYHEFVFAIPAAPARAAVPVFDALRQGLGGGMSAWIWHMPVDSEVSMRVGQGLAGFPKTLADIRWQHDGGRVRAALMHEGRPQVEIDVAAEEAPGDRRSTLRAYTSMQGVLLQSVFRMRQLRWRDHLQRDAGRLVLGTGPVAETLRGLSLSERPLASQCCTRAQGMLFHPRNLADD